MTAAFDAIDRRQERLQSYSGVEPARTRCVYYPDDRAQVAAIFRHAAAENRTVTFRAGGCSFDRQSLGDGILVSMARFDAIEFTGANTVKVGAGATWGRITRTLEAYGKVPANSVTTERATAGGTMSGNCLSRFSPAYGKEGRSIVGFELMTPDGKVLEYRRPGENASRDDDRIFRAAIGGLGYVGAVLSVTYEVLDAPAGLPPTVVESEVTCSRGLTSFVGDLVGAVAAMHRQHSSTRDPGLRDAIYSVVTIPASKPAQAMIFHSTLVRAREGRPLLVYQPHHPLRVPIELLFRLRAFNALAWWLSIEVFHKRRKTYVNQLRDFTFFMDGNGRAKRFAARFGVNLKTVQQTFVIPSDDLTDDGGVARTKEALERWLERAAEILHRHDLMPTFQDVLWLPHDHDFPLSTTATSGGFAVSYAFDSNLPSRLAAAAGALQELSEEVLAHRGRVYLVKNVYASRQALAAMYAPGAQEFLDIKRQVDPDDVLRNEFFAATLAA